MICKLQFSGDLGKDILVLNIVMKFDTVLIKIT